MSGGAKLQATAGGSVTMVADDTLTTDEVVEIETKGSIGYGQTWQDMSASRALDTLYTNTTGKPIQVNVSSTANNSSSINNKQELTAIVSGVTVAKNYIGYWNTTSSTSRVTATVSFIVPAGDTYRVDLGSTSTSLSIIWAELREVV